MRSVALSDLNRRPGEIVDMALVAPVTLTKHGRRAAVIMSAQAYDSLVSGASVQQPSRSTPAEPKKKGLSFLARKARKASAADDLDEGD